MNNKFNEDFKEDMKEEPQESGGDFVIFYLFIGGIIGSCGILYLISKLFIK
jgi:hypothetical protein